MDKDRESKNERVAGPKLSRRKFLAICAGAVVLAGGGWAFSRTQLADRLASHALGAAQGKPVLSYLRQVIVADNAHARTIMWQSDVKWQDAVVEYRLKGAKDIAAQAAFAKAHGIDYAVVAPDDPLALGAVDARYVLGRARFVLRHFQDFGVSE